MNKNRNMMFGVLALLVSVVAIGLAYAGFTGTLNVNGTGNVVSSKWDIHFENLSNATITGTTILGTPAEIKAGRTQIGDYAVSFATPGDTLSYSFDVVNEGNFDASLSSLTKGTPTCTGLDSTSNTNVCKNIEYTLEYAVSGEGYTAGDTVAVNDTLLIGERRRMKLTLKLNPFMPASELASSEVSVSNLGITLIYSQGTSTYAPNNGTMASGIKVGDEVTYGSEHFYVVSTDSTNTVLLSKYNLLVGDVYDYNDGPILNKTQGPNDSGYGLQNSTAKGWVEGDNVQYIGTVPFSGLAYWDNENCQYNSGWSCPGTYGLKSEYANASNAAGTTSYEETYPYVYRNSMSSTAPSIYHDNGTSYGYAQNNGYTIAYYVEQYVNKLKREKGLSSTASGRLMTYEEFMEVRNIATYDVDETQCNIGGKQIAMQAYSMDEATAEYAAATLCAGQEVEGATLSSMIASGDITSEYYSMLGLSNVKNIGSNFRNTSYWLGSANNSNGVWIVDSNGGLGTGFFAAGYHCGVRPVIVVPTNEL